MLADISGDEQEEVKEPEVTGILHVTFFKGNHFNVEIEGTVGEAQLERSLTSIYSSIGYSKIAARRTARKDMQHAISLEQDNPVAAEA